MKILAWLIAVPVAVVIIAFAIANRDSVAISFDPLPYALDIPIWALTVGALAAGFVIGALLRWLLDHKWRRMARQGRRRTKALEQELARVRDKLDKATPQQGAALPAAAAPVELPAPKDVA
jgi:uncharacterized membrane protein YciS (DUF1049 family)